MTTQEKLNKRRDELAPKITKYIGIDENHWKKIPHYQWRQGFNTLSPTWLKMYEALRFHYIRETRLLGTNGMKAAEALAEADKFLEYDSIKSNQHADDFLEGK